MCHLKRILGLTESCLLHHRHKKSRYNIERSGNKALRKKTTSCPVQHIAQSKCIKLTIDTNIQVTLYKPLHFSEEPLKSVTNILNYCFKSVSFALLDGWKVTKNCFDHA